MQMQMQMHILVLEIYDDVRDSTAALIAVGESCVVSINIHHQFAAVSG